jgi:L-ascorbate metabolism protein UlaG (beta-lactamase superfamily)
MPNGLFITTDGLASIYHAGDTDVFGDMAIIQKLHAPKICILPIGDHFTMGAKGAALAVELLKPATIIPCHYKTFPVLAQSADAFRNVLASEYMERLVVPGVGQTLAWTPNGVE